MCTELLVLGAVGSRPSRRVTACLSQALATGLVLPTVFVQSLTAATEDTMADPQHPRAFAVLLEMLGHVIPTFLNRSAPATKKDVGEAALDAACDILSLMKYLSEAYLKSATKGADATLEKTNDGGKAEQYKRNARRCIELVATIVKDSRHRLLLCLTGHSVPTKKDRRNAVIEQLCQLIKKEVPAGTNGVAAAIVIDHLKLCTAWRHASWRTEASASQHLIQTLASVEKCVCCNTAAERAVVWRVAAATTGASAESMLWAMCTEALQESSTSPADVARSACFLLIRIPKLLKALVCATGENEATILEWSADSAERVLARMGGYRQRLDEAGSAYSTVGCVVSCDVKGAFAASLAMYGVGAPGAADDGANGAMADCLPMLSGDEVDFIMAGISQPLDVNAAFKIIVERFGSQQKLIWNVASMAAHGRLIELQDRIAIFAAAHDAAIESKGQGVLSHIQDGGHMLCRLVQEWITKIFMRQPLALPPSLPPASHQLDAIFQFALKSDASDDRVGNIVANMTSQQLRSLGDALGGQLVFSVALLNTDQIRGMFTKLLRVAPLVLVQTVHWCSAQLTGCAHGSSERRTALVLLLLHVGEVGAAVQSAVGEVTNGAAAIAADIIVQLVVECLHGRLRTHDCDGRLGNFKSVIKLVHAGLTSPTYIASHIHVDTLSPLVEKIIERTDAGDVYRAADALFAYSAAEIRSLGSRAASDGLTRVLRVWLPAACSRIRLAVQGEAIAELVLRALQWCAIRESVTCKESNRDDGVSRKRSAATADNDADYSDVLCSVLKLLCQVLKDPSNVQMSFALHFARRASATTGEEGLFGGAGDCSLAIELGETISHGLRLCGHISVTRPFWNLTSSQRRAAFAAFLALPPLT